MKSAVRPAAPPARLAAHIRRIRAGEAELTRAFFIDMLLWGTLLNLFTSGTAMVALGAGLPGPLALAIFLSPLPYNLLLCRSVFRAGDRTGGIWATAAAIAACFWTIAVTII